MSSQDGLRKLPLATASPATAHRPRSGKVFPDIIPLKLKLELSGIRVSQMCPPPTVLAGHWTFIPIHGSWSYGAGRHCMASSRVSQDGFVLDDIVLSFSGWLCTPTAPSQVSRDDFVPNGIVSSFSRWACT